METSNPIAFTAAVEGSLDEVIVRRLISHVGATPAAIYGKQGKHHLLERLHSYNAAALLQPMASPNGPGSRLRMRAAVSCRASASPHVPDVLSRRCTCGRGVASCRS